MEQDNTITQENFDSLRRSETIPRDVENAFRTRLGVGKAASATAVYTGTVGSTGGAGTPFPTTWTSARTSGQPTGDYTITHNLGTSKYGLTVTVGGASLATWEIFSKGSNSFRIQTYSVGASIQDHTFDFILVKP